MSKINGNSHSNHAHRGDKVAEQWICWQCHHKYPTSAELSVHLAECPDPERKMLSPNDNEYETLLGCPFCPDTTHFSEKKPFHINEFNDHVKTAHFHIRGLKCPYCCLTTTPLDISILTAHIMQDHNLHWRPSPFTMSHMRDDVIIQRALTCLGCGESFYTASQDLATPSDDFVHHMTMCEKIGGSVVADQISPKGDRFTKPFLREFNLRSKSTSWDFAERYPHSRGYARRPKTLEQKLAEIEVYNATRRPSSKNAKSKKLQIERKRLPNSRIDVPLDLPPSPPAAKKQKLVESGRVFICPVCGDNTSMTLRERDEHLTKNHDMELVFACQLCGKAYPLYIALRRHAAKDHNEDYDGCLYGLGNTEVQGDTYDCSRCNLVSFTDQKVLQQHIKIMHKPPKKDPVPGRGRGRPPKIAYLQNGESGVGEKETDDSDNKQSADVKLDADGVPQKRARGRPPGSKNRKSYASDSNTVHSNDSNEPNDYRLSNKQSLSAVVAGSNTNGTFFVSELENKMKLVSPDEKTTFCHDCHQQFHNQRELLLHIEIDHTETDSNQLACHVCGRIFFGPDMKMDLIGHLRIVHGKQDGAAAGSPVCSAVECSHSECEAVFYSARLRQLHQCPMKGILERMHNLLNIPQEVVDGTIEGTIDMLTLPDELHFQCDPRVLATEIAADEIGTFVLAYGCSECNYVFSGIDSTERYLEHRQTGNCTA